MALRPKILYPGQTSSVDAGYPHGKARNRATPGDGTGTPWEQNLVNDIFGFQQALLVNAGITPSDTPDNALSSQYLEAVGFFTKELNAVYALQFTEIVRGFDLDPVFPLRLTSCIDAAYQPWIVFVHSTGRVKRSKTSNADDTLGGAQPTGGFVAIEAISGGQDGYLLAIESVPGNVYASTDAGNTWPISAALPTTGSWSALNYSTELSKWVAVGAGKVAHSPAAPSLSWTGATGATLATAPLRVVVPRVGETGHGVLVIPESSENATLYSLNGTSFTSTAWGGPISDGCWSEYHKKWFLLNTAGQLYRASTLDGIWTVESTLWQEGFSVYKRIYPLGRYLVILGDVVSGAANRTVGSVLVTDLTRFGSFTVDGGEHDHIFEFDGRLVLGRGASGPQIDLALGMRAPWLL